MFKCGVISGPYFPVFGLNTEIYGVNLRIQSEYRKIQTRNNSVFEHFFTQCNNMSKHEDYRLKIPGSLDKRLKALQS